MRLQLSIARLGGDEQMLDARNIRWADFQAAVRLWDGWPDDDCRAAAGGLVAGVLTMPLQPVEGFSLLDAAGDWLQSEARHGGLQRISAEGILSAIAPALSGLSQWRNPGAGLAPLAMLVEHPGVLRGGNVYTSRRVLVGGANGPINSGDY